MDQNLRSRILHWLEAPVFEGDEAKTFRSRLLNAMTLTITSFLVIVLPVVLLNSTIPFSTKLVACLIVANGIFVRYLLFKDRVDQAGFLGIFVGFLLITGSIFSMGTILTPTTSAYLFIIIASGILFQLRGIILATAASSLAVGAIILAGDAGLLPERVYTGHFTHWAVYVLVFSIIGGVVNFSLSAMMKALVRSKKEIAERTRVEAQLRQSEARFRNLFEQTHDAVLINALDGSFQTANQRAAQMLGYPLEELPGLSLGDVTVQMEEGRDILASLLEGRDVPHHERLYRRKDGTTFPAEVYMDLVRDAQGAPLYIQSVVRDISQRKQAENALITANDQLNARVMEIVRLHTELKELSVRDPLTGVYNRRHLGDMLAQEIARVKREKNSLSVIVIDIDHFKHLNDAYGHQAGDRILVSFSRLVKSLLRSTDTLCRFGGEEFIIVMPGASVSAAEKRAEEIRRQVEKSLLRYRGSTLKMTISLGVAAYPEHGRNADEVTLKADQALYHSKKTGRNRVSVWRSEFSSQFASVESQAAAPEQPDAH